MIKQTHKHFLKEIIIYKIWIIKNYNFCQIERKKKVKIFKKKIIFFINFNKNSKYFIKI